MLAPAPDGLEAFSITVSWLPNGLKWVGTVFEHRVDVAGERVAKVAEEHFYGLAECNGAYEAAMLTASEYHRHQ